MLELDIESRDYDFLGMAAQIEAYCEKNRIAKKTAGYIQLAFEETVARLLVPAMESPRVQAVCEYSEERDRAAWTFDYGDSRPGAGVPLDVTASGDALSLAVLKGMTEDMEYAWNEGAALPNQLKMKVKRP